LKKERRKQLKLSRINQLKDERIREYARRQAEEKERMKEQEKADEIARKEYQVILDTERMHKDRLINAKKRNYGTIQNNYV